MNNTLNILNGLEILYPNSIIPQLKRTLDKFPECNITMQDAFSLGQLKSKLWLIEHLPENLGTVFICAGWYGTLAALMFERSKQKFNKIRSFDIDETCAPVADTINRPWVMDGWQFKASTLNIVDMQYPTTYKTYRANGTSLELTEMPDTIINTSCEHIENFSEWYNTIPRGKLVILQSNDFFEIDQHINCVRNIEEFKEMAPIANILYSGKLELEKYSRFMLVGYK
jgi:hypothetical protein